MCMECNEPVKPLCPVYVCTGKPYHRNKNLPIASPWMDGKRNWGKHSIRRLGKALVLKRILLCLTGTILCNTSSPGCRVCMYVCMYVCQRPSIQFLRVSWGLDYGWQYCVSRQELLNCSRNTLWGGYVLFCLLCIREARRKRAGDVSMGGTIGKPPFNYKVLQYT